MRLDTRLLSYSLLAMNHHISMAVTDPKKILVLPKSVEISSAKRQGSKVLGDGIQQSPGRGDP